MRLRGGVIDLRTSAYLEMQMGVTLPSRNIQQRRMAP